MSEDVGNSFVEWQSGKVEVFNDNYGSDEMYGKWSSSQQLLSRNIQDSLSSTYQNLVHYQLHDPLPTFKILNAL